MFNSPMARNSPGYSRQVRPAIRRVPLWWQTYVVDVVVRTEQDAAEHRRTVPVGRSVWSVAVVVVAATLSLTMIRYLRAPEFLETMSVNSQFARLVWWASLSIGAYVAIPMGAIVLLRGRVGDFGARFPRSLRSGRPYLVLFGLSVPILVVASFLPAFQQAYPFYEPDAGQAWWPKVAIFWALYVLQFVAVEFFFRGFLLFGLAPRLGIAAVFVMVIPYSMIHFTKPLAETLSSILGGTVLGFLSLKTGTFWWAAAIHVGIAMTMEVLSLWHVGFF